MHPIRPHGPKCVCDSFVEVTPGAEEMPCPALWDAYHTHQPFGVEEDHWTVAHRIEGRASTGVKVWYSWLRASPVPETGEGETP
jgi:hypothetical protein